ncbi:MAG: glycosyltransferase family 2 protein [Thermodesulfovibrionales bacterium]
MSVYNGEARLRRSLDSIVLQEGVDFDFIIVDDGSTDESPKILAEYAASDPRIRLIHQENTGLTKALIRGCAAARGRYIARHDAGDISLPGRLKKQLFYVKARNAASLVSCGCRYYGPGMEHLYDVVPDEAEATKRLLTLDLGQIQGPSHHGTTMFSRDLYSKVGGYRANFYFAQDLDLWTRLVEYGTHYIVPEVLYETILDIDSLSGVYRKEQMKTAKLILECGRLRRNGLNEAPALRSANSIGPSRIRKGGSRIRRAQAFYFIGTCLTQRKNPIAKKYFVSALREFPLHFKAAARLIFIL